MEPLTYRAAGVDIEAGDEAVRRIGPLARATLRPEVLGGIGAFASFVRVPPGYAEPVLVSSTDGVGSKLTPDQIKKWIVSPKEMKADSKMKAYPSLAAGDLDALVAYLSSLKKKE